MSHHTLAVFLVLAIAQLFVIHVKGSCADPDTCATTAAAMLTCVSEVCKAKIGGTCTASSSDECVDGADPCPATGTLVCACPDKFGANSDNTGCLAYVGEVCSATQQCVENTNECSATVEECACKTGYTASSDNSACDGATGVMASLVLLVSAFLTSRVV